MNPLLIVDAGPKAQPAPQAAAAAGAPREGVIFAALVEAEVESVPLDGGSEIAENAAEVLFTDPEVDARMPKDEAIDAITLQVVLPDTAKVPLEVREGQLITVKSAVAAQAIQHGQSVKVTDEGETETGRRAMPIPVEAVATRTGAVSATTAQAIVAARDTRAEPDQGAGKPSQRDAPPSVTELAGQKSSKDTHGKFTQQDGVVRPASMMQAMPAPKDVPIAIPDKFMPTRKDLRAEVPNMPETRGPAPQAQAPTLPATAALQTGATQPKGFSLQWGDREIAIPRGMGETGQVMAHEARAGVNNVHGSSITPNVATDAGRQVAHQISAAMVSSQGRATEIALNPEELGRVRMRLTAIEGVVTLVLTSERPETNELLRRHIDVLAQEFRAIGYESMAFSFDGNGQSDGSEPSVPLPQQEEQDATPTVQQGATNDHTSGGLDVRV